MLRVILSGLLVGWVIVFPHAASAGDDSEDSRLRSGAFLGVHFVYALSDFDFKTSAISADDSPGVEVFAGYRFNRFVSLEGVLHYLDEFDIDTRDFRTGGSRRLATAWGISFMPATKVYPLADVLPPWVQPFGQFGVGVLFAHADGGFTDNDATVGFRFGGGVDIYLAPQVVLRAGGGYVLAGSDIELLGVEVEPSYAPITAGLEFRF